MDHFEYTVMPAPDRGSRNKSARTPTERYALALSEAINEMAVEGWEYVRAETLPSDERSGIASRQTLWHHLLIFRRPLAVEVEVLAQPRAAEPQPVKPAPSVATPATAVIETPEPEPEMPEAVPEKSSPKVEPALKGPSLRKPAAPAPAPVSATPRLGPAAR